MSGNFQKKTSNVFVTLFIGLIVVSFMFTGYESMRGTPDTIAKVGSTPIKFREYQQEYERQMGFYKRIFGGKDLTKEQIRQFRIKDNTINSLVEKKILLNLADDLDVVPGNERIKAEIKNLPYFKTNDQFDINKYKAILAANSLTPKDFEEDI
ncbi:SurA N-terminal domain-containing protein, partial [Bacteriovoracaceae bacterium]|nr:SurA N-terminal domain-containing protein [Bacteriovoracaceae bacterium]